MTKRFKIYYNGISKNFTIHPKYSKHHYEIINKTYRDFTTTKLYKILKDIDFKEQWQDIYLEDGRHLCLCIDYRDDYYTIYNAEGSMSFLEAVRAWEDFKEYFEFDNKIIQNMINVIDIQVEAKFFNPKSVKDIEKVIIEKSDLKFNSMQINDQKRLLNVMIKVGKGLK